ncbi:hypothetical protein CPB84DRAFT_1827577 [Gymnopilus junonius]|uniref:Uncharacterized protein n=1 Tax=Gymnopilus junonius TaxID=109634 RepID=A0A9P5NF42_GYMJU|nr:hypothetical protein CPB84DRAFT_1827577 [Gymnopilus junonius]
MASRIQVRTSVLSRRRPRTCPDHHMGPPPGAEAVLRWAVRSRIWASRLEWTDVDDDGMEGGEWGVDGGGVISPYSYSPGPQQMQQNLAQSQPSMSQGVQLPVLLEPQLQERDYASGAGPSSYNYGNNSSNNPPLTPSDASYPNTGSGSSSAGYYPGSNSAGSEHSSSGVGPYSGGGVVYNPRSAKEMEARGMRLVNPDNNVGDPQYQAYLQYGPGGIAQQGQASSALGSLIMDMGIHNTPGSSPTSALSSSLSGSPPDQQAGSAVIVHQDGGRVVMRKGEAGGIQEEEEQGPSEIPPTYDSLPNARPADA